MKAKPPPTSIDGSPLPRIWAIAFCVLVAATHRLWLVQHDVPAVALLTSLGELPTEFAWLAWAGPAVFLPAAVAIALAPDRFRAAWWMVAIGLMISFALDQHRLQPWAYQTAIYSVVFAVFSSQTASRLLIPLAASIYIYSAAGKLDYQFAHTVGQEFLNVVLKPLGLTTAFGEAFRVKLALVLPLVELAAGVLLLWRKTRRHAAVVIIAMHVSLLVILGPFGLRHSLGVLCWNAALLAQAYCLFLRKPSNHKTETQSASSRIASSTWAQRFACVIVAFALVAPITERAGWWDHWLSWALYLPHNSRVEVEVHRSAVPQLPTELVDGMSESETNVWQELPLDQWSIQALGVPIYPQARYQLALACLIAENHGLEKSAVRCRVRGVADRWTGARSEKPLLGLSEMKESLNNDYWLVPRID